MRKVSTITFPYPTYGQGLIARVLIAPDAAFELCAPPLTLPHLLRNP